jgi:tRNA pseudouridine55 synthase
VLVGRATRLARFVEAQPKTYLATGRLGVRTSTDDLTGDAITSESTALVSEGTLRDVLAEFLGTSLQRPPEFSAKRVDGERSYRKARRGEKVDLAPVSVTVHEINLLAFRPPDFEFQVRVSAGTYIRAIARDVGEQLGVGAHLRQLRRQSIGSLRVEQAVALDQVGPEALVPPGRVLADLPVVNLDDTARNDVSHGRAVADDSPGRQGEGAVALLAGGELLAVARPVNGRLHPIVVLESP